MRVLLPPVGMDEEFWQASGLLGEGHAAVVYPGHGSRATARPWPGLEQLADEVAELFADTADSGGADLIGVSLGGMIAQHVALRHPAVVRSLVLVSTTARTGRDLKLDRASRSGEDAWPGVVEETLARWFTAELLAAQPEHPGVLCVRRSLARVDPDAWAGAWRAMAYQDVLEELRAVQVPVSCVAGSEDRSAPLAALAAIAERVPRSRLLVMDAAHVAPVERPDEFRALIEDHERWVAAG